MRTFFILLLASITKGFKKMLKYLTSYLLMLLLLNACVTGDSPNSTSSSSFVKTSATSGNQCPTGVTVKVNGKSVDATIPNPFHGFVNPGFRTQNDQLVIELNVKEIGLFELTEFEMSQLQPGTFGGDQFRLTLSYSPYSSGTCVHDNYKQDSRLIIEKYSQAEKRIAGCLYGKVDCEGGKSIEINTAVRGKIF